MDSDGMSAGVGTLGEDSKRSGKGVLSSRVAHDVTQTRTITLRRDDVALAGHLHTPDEFVETGSYGAVIVQGSFTSVKEQMPDTYARKLAELGFVGLAFDYAHYGQSGGQPRQLECPTEKVEDLRAAVTFLADLPYIKKVAVVGICTSASNVADLVATDARVAAFATVAGFLPSPTLNEPMFGAEGLADRVSASVEARKAYEETGQVVTVPTYSETDPAAVNYRPTPGAYDYYLNPERGNVPEYRNGSALMGIEQFLALDPVKQAASITTPAIVVHSDGSAFPEQARPFYECLAGPKELVWADGNHFDYYDSPAQVDNAVAQVARFFQAHMV